MKRGEELIPTEPQPGISSRDKSPISRNPLGCGMRFIIPYGSGATLIPKRNLLKRFSLYFF
jgi:hypothetical protein